MISKEENVRLTQVARGTPAGEMLRRYWWPVAFSDEVKGPRPKRVRLLAEDFVLFRDSSARVGMLDLLCAHRRTTLDRGRVEDRGLRCCFHGWLFDTAGRCLETPCEDPASRFKDSVSMKAYPVQEAGGLVFAYLGPQPVPLLPNYDLLIDAPGTRYSYGYTQHCNWLQCAENAADVTHLNWLHAGPYPMYAAKRPQVEWHSRAYGLDYSISYPDLDADNYGSVVFPSFNRFASGRTEQRKAQGARQNMVFRTPQDETTELNFFISFYPNPQGPLIQKTETPPERAHRGPWMPTERGVYAPGDEEWWGVASSDQDRMALESQGVIYDRSEERLAPSDRGVAMFRQMMRESIDAVAEGRDPIGIIRDPAKNTVIEFGAHFHDIAPALSLVDSQAT